MDLSESYIYKRNKINKFYFRNMLFPFLIEFGLVIRATFLQRRRDPSAFAEVDTSSLVEVILVFLAIPFILSKRGQRAIKLLFAGPIKYYLFYCLWCFITIFWASSLLYSLFRIVELLTILFLFAFLFVDIRSKEYAKMVLLFFVIFSLLVGIGNNFRSGAFSFESFHSNSYPMLAAAGIIIGFYIYKDKKYFDYDLLKIRYAAVLLFIISVLGIIAGTSSASNVSLVIAIILISSMRRSNLLTLFLVIFSIVVVWYFWENYQTQIIDIVFPGKSLESIKTGHGRTAMWQYYINGILEKPLFGYGFPTGEKEGFRYGFGLTNSSHNMLISVAINTGFVGLLLFLIFVLKYTLFLIRKLKEGHLDMKWITGAWIVFLVNSLSMPALGSHWMWITSSVLCVLVYSVFYYK